jgi:zinc protease
MRAFVQRRFARDNALIGVVGDIDAKELGALLDKTFAALPAKATPWEVPEAKPALDNRTRVVRKSVPQSALVFAGPGLKRDDPDFYVAYVMNHILGGGGFTSRLYQEVREKRGLAYSAGSSLVSLAHAALAQGGAGTANARVDETLAVVRAEWKRMAESGITQAELDDAKTYLTGSFPLRFSSTGNIASMLVAMQIDRLGIDFLSHRNGYIEAVTRDDVNRLAKKLLDENRLIIVVVGDPQGVIGTN